MKTKTRIAGPDTQANEVAWYRQHGKHKDRIRRLRVHPFDEYVIGDFSWNHRYPDRQEFVEHLMPQ